MELSDKEITEFRLKKIGYVFQFYNLILLLAVFENVELPMYLLGVRKEEGEERRSIEVTSIHWDSAPSS
jgi:putative ABC transport system ATP-binding protein